MLVDNGYRTGAFVGSFVLDGKYGLDQGFEHYSAPLAAELSGSSGNRVERPAGEVVDDALAWMAGIEQDEPFSTALRESLREAGLTPAAIDVAAFAVENAFERNYDVRPDEVVALGGKADRRNGIGLAERAVAIV